MKVELIGGTTFEDLPQLTCSSCENEFFLEALLFKKASSLVTKSGLTEIGAFEVYLCTKCGTNLNMAAGIEDPV